MTKEDWTILYKDLCARLPYEPKIHVSGDTFYDEREPYDAFLDIMKLRDFRLNKIEIKPYFRKLSSMTDDEEEELSKHYGFHIWINEINIWYHIEGYWDDENECSSKDYLKLFDWLNEHHFDYRGLIDKGLALEIKK